MLFTELRFLPFFVLAFAVHWLLRRESWRRAWLLVCSYAFYAAWEPRFLLLIIASTLVDWYVGLRLVRPGARKRAWLGLSLVVNLGMLGTFKYADFFLDSTVEFLRLAGFEPHVGTLALILPVGISFYTFQTLSYSIDVYRGTLAPRKSLLDVAFFVAFFPQLVAGPIVRAAEFLPQLDVRRRLAQVDVRAALLLFLAGFVKKACISDNLAPAIDAFYAAPAKYDVLGAWAAAIYYTIQIYCDFSGYSDMAIACGALLGFRLPLNFFFPYFSGDVREFWRRWHISLSSWIRDYLYVPLGGSRGSRLRTHVNLLIAMTLCGLWHGASWNFVLWGALHAVALIVHREWSRRVSEASPLRRVSAALGVPLTFLTWTVSMVLFRARGAEATWQALRSVVLFDAPGGRNFGWSFLGVLAALAVLHALARFGGGRALWRALPERGFALAWGAAFALALAFSSPQTQPFLYFQF